MPSDEQRLKRAVRAAFDQAAPSYAAAAQVQQQICDALSTLMQQHGPGLDPTRILDGGCGTGFGLERLRQVFPHAELIALDFAPAMLRQLPACSPSRICGDLEALPLASGCCDAVWSSLALQWCTPQRALAELARILRPGGRAWLATLGPQTLQELDAVWRQHGRPSPRIQFHNTHDWLSAARQAGLHCRARQNLLLPALAPDLRSLLRQIKAIGAHRIDPAQRRPLGKDSWRALEASYEHYRRSDGLLPASYDTILIALEKPL